jgi:hypothetical protein
MSLLVNAWSMTGRLRRCWLLTVATPARHAEALLPPGLELVRDGEDARWNMVVCNVTHLRPVPLPAWTGSSYWHVAYRLWVRPRGSTEEGLYFVRSDADSRWIGFWGNRLTRFNFHHAGITVDEERPEARIWIRAHGADASLVLRRPEENCDAATEELSRRLSYPPRAYTPLGGRIQCVQVQRSEKQWKCRPVEAVKSGLEFFEGMKPRLVLAQEVAPIEYRWSRGFMLKGGAR